MKIMYVKIFVEMEKYLFQNVTMEIQYQAMDVVRTVLNKIQVSLNVIFRLFQQSVRAKESLNMKLEPF